MNIIFSGMDAIPVGSRKDARECLIEITKDTSKRFASFYLPITNSEYLFKKMKSEEGVRWILYKINKLS